jgi:hypothetical protein
MSATYQQALLTLQRKRTGGNQHVTVKHIHQQVNVTQGGQAVVAGDKVRKSIDNPETIYGPGIWDTPGFALVLSWLAQKWHRRCHKLAPRGSQSPEQYLIKEQQKACLDSAAAELIREISHGRSLN